VDTASNRMPVPSSAALRGRSFLVVDQTAPHGDPRHGPSASSQSGCNRLTALAATAVHAAGSVIADKPSFFRSMQLTARSSHAALMSFFTDRRAGRASARRSTAERCLPARRAPNPYPAASRICGVHPPAAVGFCGQFGRVVVHAGHGRFSCLIRQSMCHRGKRAMQASRPHVTSGKRRFSCRDGGIPKAIAKRPW